MTGWTFPAFVGLLGGGLLFFAVLVPIVVVQSRRYGRVSVARTLGAAAVSVYAVALAAYTFLPLPQVIEQCSPAQWVPLHSFDDIARETEGLSITGVLTSRATLQVVYNVALFVPLGVIARRYWHRGIVVSTLIGAAVSLLIETTQLTGIFGIYPCAFRVADVDDLLANTLGALIGALIAPLLLWWMPSAARLERERGFARPVTVWRRWLAMLIDVVLYGAISTLLGIAVRVAQLLLSGDRATIAAPSVPEALLVGLAPLVVFVVAALQGSGASPGQRAMWLEPRWRGAAGAAGAPDEASEGVAVGVRGTAARRLVRALTGMGAFAVGQAADALSDAVTDQRLVLALGAVFALATLVVVLSALSVLWTRERRGLSYAIAGADLVDPRPRPAAQPGLRPTRP
ncbi:VanZ family protein [Agrococcus sp. 1P02AA]|uniref:VanZ family protein n=1 Tax=Agrococcus sp. 1P02AA TaxID=3132259 RepID=UPI0039A558E6